MNRILFAFLMILALAAPAIASTVILQWDASTDSDLKGYKVYQQSDKATLPFAHVQTVADGALIATVSGLDPSRGYFFAVTAYNSAGQESVYSNVVAIPPFPKPPANVRAISILVSP